MARSLQCTLQRAGGKTCSSEDGEVSIITVSMRVVAPLGRLPELLRTLRAMLAPTRAQPGCAQARLYVDADDASVLTLVQEWETQADLDHYLASESCKFVVAALESSQLAPEVRFDTVASRGGLEVIEIARRARALDRRPPRLV